MGSPGKNILIIDDIPSNIKVAGDFLAVDGCEILFAQDGETGLDVARQTQPDLILLDVMMPGMDGFETCRLLKADERTCKIPVIFMTALADTEHKIKGFMAGGVDYITKPIEMRELQVRVRAQLRLHDMQTRLEVQNMQLQTARADLELRVLERTAELSRTNKKLECEIEQRKRAEDELRQMNETLGQRVAQRTAELAKRNREIRELSHKTIHAMENERMALAKDLHDGIGGTLAAIMYHLEAQVERVDPSQPSSNVSLQKIISYLGNAVQESRRITKQLRPCILDDFGLRAAMEEHIRDFEAFHPNIRVRRAIRISEKDLSNNIKTVFYRVLQESLNNVGKHSEADTVDIRCYRYKGRISLVIEDNGDGFDIDQVLGPKRIRNSYGLFSMIERVEICEGTLQIESAPGQGTIIQASIPI